MKKTIWEQEGWWSWLKVIFIIACLMLIFREFGWLITFLVIIILCLWYQKP